MKQLRKAMLCLLLVLCMTPGLMPALTKATGEGVINQPYNYTLSMAAEKNEQITDTFLAAIDERKESYNPASVLISGILYAPAGTEILKATVECSGATRNVSGSDIYRMQTDFSPIGLNELQIEPDLSRAAFAFIVNFSDNNLKDGKTDAKVTLFLSKEQEIVLSTTVDIRTSMGRFYNVIPAVFDQAMFIGYQGKELDNLQERLVKLNYLKPEEATGKCDQTTMDAANRLLTANGYPSNEQNSTYITAKAMGFIESDKVKAEGEGWNLVSSLKSSITLFNREIPLWLIIAAGAALIVLLALLAMLIIGKRNKNKRQDADTEVEPGNAFITAPEDPGAQILTIGDEPTMDLNSVEEQGNGIFFGEDEPTEDLKESGYVIKVRMIYEDVYLDKELKLMEGGQAIIGRGNEATIQTNPADTSISHRHGVFTAIQGRINYQDESRNGTIYNGQRTIHKGETITILLNTKVQLEIGGHKILVIATRGS